MGVSPKDETHTKYYMIKNTAFSLQWSVQILLVQPAKKTVSAIVFFKISVVLWERYKKMKHFTVLANPSPPKKEK